MPLNSTSSPVFIPNKIKDLEYPTPFFLFSKPELLRTIQLYKDNLPEAEIYYALKANSEPEVLKAVYEADCGFEAASSYELDFLKKLGVPASRIIFGTSVKPASHIQAFSEYGVDRFAFDSQQEIDKITALVPGARVYSRALADDSGSVFTMSAKFGTAPQSAGELLMAAKNKGLKPYGISFNVGSQGLNPKAWANGILSLVPVVESLKTQGIDLEVLNLGGGYPYNYTPDSNAPSIQDIAGAIKPALAKLPYPIKIIIEPGRGLVASSMALVVSVIAKIQRPTGYWLYVDAGSYNAVLETMAYQGSIRYRITSLEHSSDDATETFILTGPTGDSLDVIDKAIRLPASIKEGDKLLIHDTGAYSTVLASRFNGFPSLPVYNF